MEWANIWKHKSKQLLLENKKWWIRNLIFRFIIIPIFLKPAFISFRELSIVRGFYSEGICRICLCNPLNQDQVHYVFFFQEFHKSLAFCTTSVHFLFPRVILCLNSSFQCQNLLPLASRHQKHWWFWEYLILKLLLC